MGSRLGGRGDQRRVRAAARAAADAGPRAARAAARGRARRGRFGAGAARRRRGAGPGPLVADRAAARAARVDPVARRRALGELLLERYGILTREQVLAEGIPGGFSAIYSELSQLETLGVARRGYFVEGLGGAQFALPGAVERLRARRGAPTSAPPLVLAAVDPAQPYGAALPWPKRRTATPGARRGSPGAYVVLVGGEPVLYLERGGRGAADARRRADDPRCEPALAALVEQVRARRDQAARRSRRSTASRR